MTSKRFWLGILVMALVFGMTAVGCNEDETDNPFAGTWTGTLYGDELTLQVGNSTWKAIVYGEVTAEGTYKYDGNSATLYLENSAAGTATVSGNTMTVTSTEFGNMTLTKK